MLIWRGKITGEGFEIPDAVVRILPPDMSSVGELQGHGTSKAPTINQNDTSIETNIGKLVFTSWQYESRRDYAEVEFVGDGKPANWVLEEAKEELLFQ